MQRFIHLSTIIADLGEIFTLIAPVSCVPLIVALIFSEWNMILPMASVPLVFCILGLLLRQLPRSERGVRLSTALCSVALFLLACAVVSGLPFMLGLGMGFTDSVFEGMAGWTGNAFSMIPTLDTAPYTLLFWRSYMQWVGGIGIVAYSIAMASSTGLFHTKTFRNESRDESLMPSIISTGRAIWKIYGILTFVAIGVILFAGLSLWESVNLALSAISTGGFTLHGDGILYYDNLLLQYLLIPIMIAGALPFKLYYLIAENRRWSLFGDEQVKIFFIIIALAVALLTYDLVLFGNLSLFDAFQQSLFMSVSALTTTGFQIANIDSWAGVTVIFLGLLVFIGGAVGSTSGGVKLRRIALAVHALIWWFRRLFVSGKVLMPFKIEGHIIPRASAELEVAKNMLIIILSIATIIIASLFLFQFSLTSQTVTDTGFNVISAFSTCGLSTGGVTPDMPLVSKWIYIVVMWVGRLEVIPVIMLFMAIFRGDE